MVVGQQWGEPEGPERLLGRSCRCWSAGAEARERSFVVFGADEPVFGQAGARWGHSGSLVEDGLLARGRRGGGRRHRARVPGQDAPADLAGAFYDLAGDLNESLEEGAEVHREQAPALLVVLGGPAGETGNSSAHQAFRLQARAAITM